MPEQEIETIEDRVATVLMEELAKSRSDIQLKSTLDDLGADSLDRASIIYGLEEEFNIEISDADAEIITTVGDIVHCVQKALK